MNAIRRFFDGFKHGYRVQREANQREVKTSLHPPIQRQLISAVGRSSSGLVSHNIKGLERMTADEVNRELQLGGKFVLFQYCVSMLVMTYKHPSRVYFLKSGESTFVKSLPFTLLSLVAGWWGFPWGPVYTMDALATNLRGGVDMTDAMVASFNRAAESEELT